MNGQELFEKYRIQGIQHGPGSPESQYSGLLFTALLTIGEEELYALLEQAELTGKRIDLTYPIPAEQGPSEPDGAVLVG